MEKTKLIVLSDYGLDDACAAVYLLENRVLFTQIDIAAVAGNTTAENSLKNLCKLIGHYGGDKTDLRLIDTTAEPQFYSHLPGIHGNDGMGDLLAPVAADVPVLKYADWLETVGETPFVLFSLGPCTLTLQLLRRYRPVRTVLMAGRIKAAPNYNGMEFNQAMDVRAYEACLKYPHEIATLDTCRAPLFNLAGKRTAGDTLLGKLLNRAEELAEKRHPDNCYVYDYIAAHDLTRPDIFDIIEQKDGRGNTLYGLALKPGAECCTGWH